MVVLPAFGLSQLLRIPQLKTYFCQEIASDLDSCFSVTKFGYIWYVEFQECVQIIFTIKLALLGLGCKGMDWIDLAQDRDRWWTLVSAVMNFRITYIFGELLDKQKNSQLLQKDSDPWSKLQSDLYQALNRFPYNACQVRDGCPSVCPNILFNSAPQWTDTKKIDN